MTLGGVIADADLVISTVGGERGGGSGDLVEQGADLDAVVHLLGGERGDGDLARFGIEAGVQLALRHIGLEADTGQVVAATLTTRDVDDGAEVDPLLDQVPGPLASFTADGAYDQEGVSTAAAERHPVAAIIVPPRSSVVPSETAETAPTQRDRHLQNIAEHGRAAWQKASGYTKRARAEAAIGKFKRAIGDGLPSRTDRRRAAHADVAVRPLNRMLEPGRPIPVRVA